MKKFIVFIFISFFLLACTEPPKETTTAESTLASEAAASEATDPDEELTLSPEEEKEYDSEGNNGQLFIDHFKVQTVTSFDSSDSIEIQKITDGVIDIKEVTVNRGRCELLSKPDEHQMNYSDKMVVHLWGCEASDVLEVELVTDQGYVTYNF